MDVVIVGGSPWFSRGVEALLGDDPRFTLLPHAADRTALGKALRGTGPCIVLFACHADRDLPQFTLRKARREGRDIRAVIKHQTVRPELIREAMEVGAHGCFCVDDPPETLLAMLHTVADGRTSFPFVDMSALRDDPFEQLTRKEREVLGTLSQGWSNCQISSRLGISENTVKHHLKLIYSKLGVSNRAMAVAQYLGRSQELMAG